MLVGGGKGVAGLGFVLVAALAGFVSPAEAAPTRCDGFKIAPKTLHVDATLGLADTFIGSVRLTATKAGVSPFFLPAGDLIERSSPARRIDADQIEVTSPEGELSKGDSRDLKVTVKGVRFAGEYRGAVRAAGGGCRVPLVINVVGAVEVSLVGTGDALQLQAINCSGFTCGPDEALDLLGKDIARSDEFEPQVHNSSQSPARVTGVQVALTSSLGGAAIDEASVSPTSQEFTLEPRVSKLEPIEIERDEIEPGHYTGAIYLTPIDADKRVTLPLELDVKSGPFYAILVLLTALLVQFLAWLAGRSKAQSEELRAIRSVRKKVRELPREDSDLLQGRLEAARELAMESRIDAAKEARAVIDVYIAMLAKARRLVDLVAKARGRPLPDEIAQPWGNLRQAVERGDTKAAEAAQTELLAGFGQLALERSEVALDQAERRLLEAPGAPADPHAAVTDAVDGEFLPRRAWRLARRAIVWTTVYVLPWIVRGLLVIAFVLAGLKELYLDNSTFGSDPVLNYTAMFLWGLTAAGANYALGKMIPGAGTK